MTRILAGIKRMGAAARLATRASRGERAQVLLMMAGIVTVLFVMGAAAVDTGMWFSEKRDLQKIADAASLAGVQEYLDDDIGAWDRPAAADRAQDWADANGADDGATDVLITTGTSDCRPEGDQMPWVEARPSRASPLFFSRLIGVPEFEIPAEARACVGSPRTATELSPFGVQTGFVTDPDDPNFGEPLSDCLIEDPDDPTRTRPVYGAVCILKTGAGDCEAGQCGQLTLGNLECDQTSANTLRHDFHYGTKAGCSVDQEVNTGTGGINGLLRGLNDRLLEEGLCDDMFPTGNPGYDDFDEVFSIIGDNPNEPYILPSADNAFAENDCRITVNPCEEGHVHTYLPRAIDLVLIDVLEQGEQTATITGFAGFYVIGCVEEADAAATKAAIEQDLTQMSDYLNRCDTRTGHTNILGIFVQTLEPPLNVGDPDPNLPLAIVLVK